MNLWQSKWSASCWLVLLLAALAGSPAAHAQTPAWQLALAVGTQPSGSYSLATATTTDDAGHVYVTGYFTGSLIVGGTTLSSAGGEDIFVAKWNSFAATWAWAQRAGGPANDQATALAVWGNDVYVAGTFEATAGFGAVALSSAGYTDAFVAKLLDTGSGASVQWAQRAGGPNYDLTQALAATSTSVYWLGGFIQTAQVGSVALASSYPRTLFLARLAAAGPAGTVVWAQAIEGSDSNWFAALAVQGTTLYVSGVFSRSLTLGATSLTGTGSFSLFAAKLTDTGTAGTYQWAVASSQAGTAVPIALTLGPAGAYVVGSYYGTIGLGATTLANASLGASSSDAFVAKLLDAGASGSFAWAQRAGGPADERANAVAVQGSSVYVAGTFGGVASFGPLSLSSAGPANDVFVTKLLDAGTSSSFAWATAAGGAGYDSASSLALLGTGQVYVAGTVVPPATFGSLAVGPAPADFRAFLASLTETTGLATASTAASRPLAVFPSPAHHRATVQLPAGLAAGPFTLTLLDAVGRMVRTRCLAGGAPLGPSLVELDLAGLAPGVYTVRVVAGAQAQAVRLVVE